MYHLHCTIWNDSPGMIFLDLELHTRNGTGYNLRKEESYHLHWNRNIWNVTTPESWTMNGTAVQVGRNGTNLVQHWHNLREEAKATICIGIGICQCRHCRPLLPPSLVQSRVESGNKPKPELIKQSAPQIGLNAQIFPMEI